MSFSSLSTSFPIPLRRFYITFHFHATLSLCLQNDSTCPLHVLRPSLCCTCFIFITATVVFLPFLLFFSALLSFWSRMRSSGPVHDLPALDTLPWPLHVIRKLFPHGSWCIGIGSWCHIQHSKFHRRAICLQTFTCENDYQWHSFHMKRHLNKCETHFYISHLQKRQYKWLDLIRQLTTKSNFIQRFFFFFNFAWAYVYNSNCLFCLLS